MQRCLDVERLLLHCGEPRSSAVGGEETSHLAFDTRLHTLDDWWRRGLHFTMKGGPGGVGGSVTEPWFPQA
ncbi:unnamed protein product [Gadus morhua 'NCC']